MVLLVRNPKRESGSHLAYHRPPAFIVALGLLSAVATADVVRAGTEFQTNSDGPGDQYHHAVAANADGHVAAIGGREGQTGDGDDVSGERDNDSATAVGRELRADAYATAPQISAAVSAPDGGFVVGWTSAEIFGQRFRVFSPVPTLCGVVPQGDCQTASRSTLLINHRDHDEQDKLMWRWNKRQLGSQMQFGDPTTTTDYALCLYTGTAATLIAELRIPADGTKWSAVKTKGFKYRDKTGEADGIQKVMLKVRHKDEIVAVIGRGNRLPDEPLPLALPVTAQLVKSETEECWEDRYDSEAIRTNESDQWRAKAQTP